MTLAEAKELALEVARRRFPTATDIRPQLIGSEVCVHVYQQNVGRLFHIDVFVDLTDRRRL